MGTYTSIAVDASGHPHISYHGSGLNYAYEDAAGWHLETVQAFMGWNVGHTSLALDASGGPHISYYHGTNGDLQYAYRAESVWHIQIVDVADVVGKYSSIALDALGYAHITYYDETGFDLKYARMVVGPPVFELSGVLADGTLQLTWSTVTETQYYWLYGASNLPWFVPETWPGSGYAHRLAVLPSTTNTWSSPAGIGDPAVNWTYLVVAVDAVEQPVARSNRFGEQDFEAEIP